MLSLLLASLLTITAYAETQTVYSFENGQTDGSWKVNQLEAKVLPEGIQFTTSQGGILSRTHTASHPVEALSFEYTSTSDASVTLVGKLRTRPGETQVFEIPIPIQKTVRPLRAKLNLMDYVDWDPTQLEQFGLGFAPGSEVILSDVRLHYWNVFEKMSYMLRTFWDLDEVKGHSVNFLWGPLLTYNPFGYEVFRDTLPPKAQSGMRIIYAILVLGLVMSLLLYRLNKPAAKALTLGTVIFCILLMDLRMSSEFFKGVVGDIKTITSEKSYPDYRAHGTFHAFVERAREHLIDRETFVFPIEETYPALPLMTYYSYPAIPYQPHLDQGSDTWVVFSQRSTVVKGNTLMHNGQEIGEGKMLFSLNPSTFVFRLDP